MATTLVQQLCECGCGEPAPIAKRNRYGYRKGQPKRFVNGHHVKLRRVERIQHVCRRCGRSFGVAPGEINSNARRGRRGRSYCSWACRKPARPMSQCTACGVSFYHPQVSASRRRKYCSQACAGVARARVAVTCVVCFQGYEVIPSRVGKTKCCSFDCLIKYVAAKNTQSGLDARNRCGRKAWRVARVAALERDGGCCVRCESADDLTVHHIVPWRQTRDDSVGNLVTLCRACHYRVEYLGAELPRSWGEAA